MTFQKHKLKSLIGGEGHSDDFNKKVPEPEETEIKIDQESIKDMRSQLIQIHDHFLDGLEVFYKFVDTLFSHFPDDVDKDIDGSGDDEYPETDDEDPQFDIVNRESQAPIMDKVNYVPTKSKKRKRIIFKGTFK